MKHGENSAVRQYQNGMREEKVGEVTHYFTRIEVATAKVTDGQIKVGDTVHIKGHTSDFQQEIGSMQIEHKSVEVANPGDEVAIKVKEHAREGDIVYKLIPE